MGNAQVMPAGAHLTPQGITVAQQLIGIALNVKLFINVYKTVPN